MLNPVGNMLNRMFDHSQYKHFVSLVFIMYYWQSPWWKNIREKSQLYPFAAMNTDKPFAKQASLLLRISYEDRYTNYPAFR